MIILRRAGCPSSRAWQGQSILMRSLRKFLIIVALAISTSVAIAWALRTISPVTMPLPKPTTSGTPLIGGPFTLVATNGEVVSDQTYLGKWALIFFGYTFCPDVCPTTLNNMGVAIITGQLSTFSFWLLETFPLLSTIG